MTTVKKVGKPTKNTKESKPLFTLDTNSDTLTGENIARLLESALENDGDALEDGGYIIINHGKAKIFSIESSTLPGCCGVMVLNDYTVLPDFEKMLIEFFDEIATNSKHIGITFQITTAQASSCIVLAGILSKCKNWTAVKTFKNANSGRNVTIWISNND